MLEVQVAIVLLGIVSLASWTTINSTLALMGKKSSWSSQKTARSYTIATEWEQAELEYNKQLGYGGACPTTPCTFWIRTLCSTCNVEVSANNCATWAVAAPFSQGPPLPPEFPWGRVIITTDPNTPTDPRTGASYLQAVEVDIFQTQPSCGSPVPYHLAFTSVGIR